MESTSNSNNSRFTLALCEIHNTGMHGKDASSTPGIEGHYIASVTFDPEEFYTNDWRAVCAMMRTHYATNPSLKNHVDIRNYANIVDDPRYFALNLVETTMLPGGECVAAIKTNALKRVQKAWKKAVRERKEVTKKRMAPSALRYRETHGKWPTELQAWPKATIAC